MKIVITSGGTSEKIDDVRMITNMSTGRLSSLIASAFRSRSPEAEIIYICSQTAIIPDIPYMEVVKITGVEDLIRELESISQGDTVDAVIHAMAVSDYSIKGAATVESLAEAIAEELMSSTDAVNTGAEELTRIVAGIIARNSAILDRSKKLESNYNNLLLAMERTPKVISRMRGWYPNAVLVGFKLLNNVELERLIQTGHNLLKNNGCDYVLANDLSDISGDEHRGYFIDSDMSYNEYFTKEEIAGAIASEVLDAAEKRMKRKGRIYI